MIVTPEFKECQDRQMILVPLCYHKVGSEAAEGRRLNIHPDRLETHVKYFHRRGFEFVKGMDLKQWPVRPTVCFTFDDGFASTLAAAPIFNRYAVPFSMYVVSNLVGKTSEWEGELARPLADWSALRELASQGHEIGNHTATHPHMGELDEADQLTQIEACKLALGGNGIQQGSFCFPYGSRNEASDIALKAAGVEVGLALGKRLPVQTDSKLAVPRIVVAYSDSLPLLLYRLYVRPKLKRAPR